jgi:hypothetical protein
MGNDLTSHMVENQSTPAPVSGWAATVAHFDISGPNGYENVLWTKYFASGSNVSHFTYDMYVMVDDPTRPQALEFDVNQNFGNNRYGMQFQRSQDLGCLGRQERLDYDESSRARPPLSRPTLGRA